MATQIALFGASYELLSCVIIIFSSWMRGETRQNKHSSTKDTLKYKTPECGIIHGGTVQCRAMQRSIYACICIIECRMSKDRAVVMVMQIVK